MARAYLSVFYDGKEIRRCGGNNRDIRELIYQYRINPEKFHPWMCPYLGYENHHDKIVLKARFNR